MEYFEVGTGGFEIRGYADVEAEYIVNLPQPFFQSGDIAFVYKSALKGQIEKVAIKQVVVDVINRHHQEHRIQYKDQWNRVYGSNDLINHSTALNLVTAYFQRKLSQAQSGLNSM